MCVICTQKAETSEIIIKSAQEAKAGYFISHPAALVGSVRPGARLEQHQSETICGLILYVFSVDPVFQYMLYKTGIWSDAFFLRFKVQLFYEHGTRT